MADESPLGLDARSGMGVAGPRLREARLRRGLSLSDVAQAAGVTKGFLSLAERAKTQISVPTLLRICDALDIKLGSLFDYPRRRLSASVLCSTWEVSA